MQTLVLVDIQNDFVPGGALAVKRGDEVVPVANRLIPQFDLVVATQDWHPANHRSFASQHPGRAIGDMIDLNGLPQVLWPDHCVQGTWGAQFVETLDQQAIDRVFQKGTDVEVDSYSGFFDNGQRHATGMGRFLQEQGVRTLTLLGLATDYCIKYTALDAQRLGFETYVVIDGCRGVELQAGDVAAALEEMRLAGVHCIPSSQLSGPQGRNEA